MSGSCAICISLGPWSEGARWTVAEVKEALAQAFGGEERIPAGSYADAIRELGRRLDLMGYPKPLPETGVSRSVELD